MKKKHTNGLRSLVWSPEHQEMAVVANTAGRGNLYLVNPENGQFQPIIANAELGYLMGAAWSHDGQRLLTWEISKNSTLYSVNKDGTGFSKIELPLQFIETPHYAPDDRSIIFYGVDASNSGLFEVNLDSLQARLISALVEDESSSAWSPDGTRLAYMEMDRSLGEARLVIEEPESRVVIARMPIPKGSGSTLPSVANLSWTRDGKKLVFDFGMYSSVRAVYIASADGGVVNIAQPAHAPAISADGKCLAYMSENKIFLLELPPTDTASLPTAAPAWLADLPAGRGVTNLHLDKLQWVP